jgi:phenylalanyl-tRNA synthetase beta chain
MMKISMTWLNRYVDLTGIQPEQLAETLTLAGLEVESIESLAKGTKLCIGEVLSCDAHPEADKLSITNVNIGDKTLSIVCGAPNVAAGQKVIVAQVGSVLAHTQIKETTIKGVLSQGMICSLAELGVPPKNLRPDQMDGIEVLDSSAPVGEEALSYLGLDDVVLDVKPTPNRSDFNAMWSVAYEVGALLKRPVHIPHQVGYGAQGKNTQLSVSSTTPHCPLFLGKKIGQVTIKPSPDWLRQALHAVGMSSINNVVDISNYVMLETGQPLHFYDAEKLAKLELTVRNNQRGQLSTLDDNVVQLEPNDLLITCDQKPIGLAGIMGGADSKIEQNTQSIVIEAAQFHPSSIRHTARRLNLMSEASQRFQKGLDPQAADKAMDRAVALLVEWADARDLETTVRWGEVPTHVLTVQVKHAHIEELLGARVELNDCVDVFERLRLSPVVKNQTITCTIPSYRLDLRVAEDLIEEVGRVIGYENLQPLHPSQPIPRGVYSPKQRMRQRIKTILQGYGMQEIVSYTLVSEEKIRDGVMPISEPAALISPISDDKKFVRTSLLPSMLDVVAYNQAHKQRDFQMFEITNLNSLTTQEERLGIVQTGLRQSSSWQKINHPFDFYTLKGVVVELMLQLGVAPERIQLEKDAQLPGFHPLRSVRIRVDRQLVGTMGEAHPSFQKRYHVRDVVMAEMNLEALYGLKMAKVKQAPLSKVPVVERDFAFIVERSLAAQTVVECIQKVDKNLIKTVRVFDVYEGEPLARDQKSLAISVQLQDDQVTLSEDQIKACEKRIIDAVVTHCHAQLR